MDGRFKRSFPARFKHALLGAALLAAHVLTATDIPGRDAGAAPAASPTFRPDDRPTWEQVLLKLLPYLAVLGAAVAVVAAWNRMLAREARRRQQAETEARLNAARLREAQEIAQMGNWQYDRTSDRMWCSENLFRICGMRSRTSSVSARRFLALLDPQDLDAARKILAAAWRAPMRFDFEHRIKALDGRIKHIHTRGESFLDEDGRLTRMRGTIQDITARTEAQQLLRGTQERYRSLFEDSPVVMWESDEAALRREAGTDAAVASACHPVRANAAALQFFQASSLEEFRARVGVLHRASFAPGLAAALAELRPENRVVRLAGHIAPAGGPERAVELHLSLLPGESPASGRVVCILHDITERELARHSREMLLKAEKQEALLKALRSQMNPHFLFNSLNCVDALVDESPELAHEAISHLSRVLRAALMVGQVPLIPLEDEIRVVQSFLAMERIRFEDRLRVGWKLEDRTLHCLVPPMLLQTLVENAVKYGVSSRHEGGDILIGSSTDGQHLTLEIRNGGLLAPEAQASPQVGLRNSMERLRLLYGQDATIELLQEEGHRVLARVRIPLRERDPARNGEPSTGSTSSSA